MTRPVSLAPVVAVFTWGLVTLACSAPAESGSDDGVGGGTFEPGAGGTGMSTGGGGGLATGSTSGLPSGGVGSGGVSTGGLGSGGLGSGGLGTGGYPAGGTGGEPPGSGGAATGGTASGGAGTGGDNGLPSPADSFTFSSLDGWHVAPKADLIPGATATIGSDAGASDNAVLALTVPGHPELTSSSYVGPGAHAIEVVKDGGAQLYGRYEFDVSFASCGGDEEMVNGLFTYFNNGSDGDSDGVADNSEIDIEHLCGDPEMLWLTVWTDYQENPSLAFRRTSRAINMRTGWYQETAHGNSDFGGAWTNGQLDGFGIPNFPVAGTYYTVGFEWTENTVRYFIILEGEEVDLFTVSGSTYVPQRPASLLLNLWHSSTQWWGNTTADFPTNTATLRFDGVRVWTGDQL